MRTALEQHPQLVEYLIAIPVDPTGPRQGRGKSLHEKVYDPGGWLSGWQSAASQRGMKVTFRAEWATNLITRFRNIDVSGARTRYWFDAEILADQWWQDRLEEAVQAARPRYLPALNVPVPTTQALAAVCGDPEVAVALESDISSLRHLTDNVRRDPLGTETAGAPAAVDFDPARQSLAHLIDALTRWKDDPSLDAAAHLREALITAQQQVASAEQAETAALDAQFGPRWDTPSWRQMQAEYMVSLPATAVDALRQLEEALTELASRVHALAGLRSAHAVLLTSEAGQGKTFVTLDTVQRRLDRGLLGVFLHGRPFHQGDILQQVRERLGLPQDPQRGRRTLPAGPGGPILRQPRPRRGRRTQRVTTTDRMAGPTRHPLKGVSSRPSGQACSVSAPGHAVVSPPWVGRLRQTGPRSDAASRPPGADESWHRASF
ncbi:hypothetical protein [Streptomyces umbrinus]|uniref:hypothetical protein n=1 Tax=Streptomyces umbrinus TaxID=67370 RepID=UPI00343627C9